MTNRDEQFLRLLQQAIDLARVGANRKGDQAIHYETVARNFEAISEKVRGGRWETAFGSGLGAMRALSEWDLDDDALCAAVAAAEDHHRQFGAGRSKTANHPSRPFGASAFERATAPSVQSAASG